MRIPNVPFAPQRSEIINLRGGVDENISSLQQGPGSLLEVANYMIAEGQSGGYVSVKGYERYDGTSLASEVEITTLAVNDPIDTTLFAGDSITGTTGEATVLGTSIVNDGILEVEVELVSDTFIRGEALTVAAVTIGTFRNTKIISPTEDFHSLYDIRRDEILPVGNTACEGKVLGVVIFEDFVYAFRKKVTVDEVGMYKASGTGWVEVDTSADPIVYSADNHDFIFTRYNFYATAGTEELYWVDSVNQARSFDGTTVRTISNCGMVTLTNPESATIDDNDACLQLNKLEHGWDNTLELNVTTTTVAEGDWLTMTITDATLRTFFDTYGARIKFRDLDDDEWVYPVFVSAGAASEVVIIFEANNAVASGTYDLLFYYDEDQPENTTTESTPTPTVTVTVNTVLRRDFSTTQSTDAPINITARSNRLYLAYEGGSLQYSELGNPYGWYGLNGAGEIGTGQEITNLVVGVGGSLVILNTSSILIVNGETPSSWVINTFSPVSGAYAKTAKRLLGTIFFLDDRGITTMEAVQEYGDYAANSISANFKETLFNNIDYLTTANTSRDLNQYRLFFSNGLGIFVSFKSKQLQGATFVQFPLNISTVAEGTIGVKEEVLFFGTSTASYSGENTDGYVYKMDSGHSFDSHKIITKMTTNYYHYKSPRNWKRFLTAMVEGNTTKSTLFDIKIDYDYGTSDLPTTEFIDDKAGEIVSGSLYGSSEYGTAIYGSGAVLSRTPVYLTGMGTNASFKILTNLRFAEQHVIQNLLVDYTLLSRRI